jgi:dipeptidyl aminopeptidase/acylaminoacyl peptidase
MNIDLDTYLDLPRVAGLALSGDGRRLVTTVATRAPDGKKYVTALWEIDPTGDAPPRRLTWSPAAASSPTFLPNGGLLFVSTRTDPDAKPDEADDETARLWLLPADGAEARPVHEAPGGVRSIAVARDAGTVALVVSAFPDTDTAEEDKEKAKARKDAGVGAQLFEGYPIRYWDHYLGPRAERLHVAGAPDRHAGRLDEVRQLTGAEGLALHEVSFDISPDGRTIVTGWRRDGANDVHIDLVAIDTATGERRNLARERGFDHDGVRVSPDGSSVACVRDRHGDLEHGPRPSLVVVDVATGEMRDIGRGADLWFGAPVWAADGSALFVVADQDGRAPVFRVDVASGAVTRLSAAGQFTDVCISPDGNTVFALRSTFGDPPHAVALDARAADQEPRVLRSPGHPIEVPGRAERVETAAADGTRVGSWLILPADASVSSPAPLVVFIHGGPIGSWNGWQWRWNPQLLAERGYAVLLPDPAISTGYGQAFVDRGRGRWGEDPYTDLVAAVDAAVSRADIDETRTAAMGGSFGGYMANWVAGHTDRFRCIVTHASLWALDQFHGTTDSAPHWEREFGDPYADRSRYEAASPHRHIGNIRTPMLVIHGELDHRVPIGEALRLWTDLQRHGVDAKFLYFPDENHWILKPQNAKVWYETVFAFLDHHVLGKEWQRPSLL